MGPRYLFSHEEIDCLVDRRKSLFSGDILAELEAERAKLHADFDADAAWLDREQDRCGLKAARARIDETATNEHRLYCECCNVVPTTPAGMQALLRFLIEESIVDVTGEDDQLAREGLASLEQAIANFAAVADGLAVSQF